MRTSITFPHRIVLGALAIGVLGAVATSAATSTTAPKADAAPACTASELASTASGVLGEAGGYLNSHPDADNVLTAAANQAPEDARSSVRGYFTAHPNEFLDLQNITQPLNNMRNECGVALTPSHIAALIETISG
jgi:hemophore-related protein